MVCREKQGHYATGFKPTRMISLLCNVKKKERNVFFTTEAHGGQFVAGAVSVDDHHPCTVVPL